MDSIQADQYLFMKTVTSGPLRVLVYQVGISACRAKVLVAPLLRISKVAVARYEVMVAEDPIHAPAYVSFTARVFCEVPILDTPKSVIAKGENSPSLPILAKNVTLKE